MSVNDLVTDVPSIITVLSSISTLFVAILTYFNLRIVSKQTNFLEKQVLYQRLDSYPLVQVKEVKYVGNSIHLTLKNVGKGPATHLAISNQFSAMNLSKTGQDSEGRPIVNEKGELPVKDFKFVQKVKDDKGKTMHPSSGVNLLEDESGKSILYPDEEKTYILPKINFCFKYGRGMYSDSYSPEYTKMTEILLNNRVGFISLDLNLRYKDFSEIRTEFEFIKSIVVSLRSHKNLEDAMKENKEFKQRTLYFDEIDYLPLDIYESSKTHRGQLENAPHFD